MIILESLPAVNVALLGGVNGSLGHFELICRLKHEGHGGRELDGNEIRLGGTLDVR